MSQISSQPVNWQIVACLLNGKTAQTQASMAARSGADILEFRLDDYAPKEIAALLKAAPLLQKKIKLPWIVTVRALGEQGPLKSRQKYTDAQRAQIILQFLPFTTYVDLELSSTEFLLAVLPHVRRSKKKVIFSYHDFNAMPTQRELGILSTRFKRYAQAGDIFKIAAMPSDMDQVLWFLQQCRQMRLQQRAFIAMGQIGRVSRTMGFAFGSCLTYATLGRLSAPGQLTLPQLVQFKKALLT